MIGGKKREVCGGESCHSLCSEVPFGFSLVGSDWVGLQVVGRWTARDAHLRDHLKKVWVMSKEFDSLFMEFIPKEHNVHADRIANAAIDKELQIQEAVSNYFDRSNGAWQHGSPQTEPTPARVLSKLRPASPPLDVHCKNAGTIKSATKASARNVSITLPRVPVMSDDMQTSDSDLTRTIESLATYKADRFWADRLSISDEASTSTASEVDDDDDLEGYCRSSLKTGEKRAPAAANGRGSGDDSREEQAAAAAAEDPAPGGSQTIQLSEADCDRLVEAVIERLKKTRVPNSNDADSHT